MHNLGVPHADREQQVAGTVLSTPYAIVRATQICRNVETAVRLPSARPLPFFRHHSCYIRYRASSHGCSVVTVPGSVSCLAACQSDRLALKDGSVHGPATLRCCQI